MQYAIFFVCNIKAKGKRAVKSAMGAIEGREVKGVEGMVAWGQAELKHTHTQAEHHRAPNTTLRWDNEMSGKKVVENSQYLTFCRK